MKKKIYLLTVILGVMIMVGCTGAKKADNSGQSDSARVVDIHTAENSLDYYGEYKGTIPAADCPGINVTLILNKDNTYSNEYNYIDRKGAEFTEKGTYSVKGNLVTFKENNGREYNYKLEEGQIRMLDGDDKEIEGDLREMYVLKKVK